MPTVVLYGFVVSCRSALSEEYSISYVSAEKGAGWDGEISAILKPEKPLGQSHLFRSLCFPLMSSI